MQKANMKITGFIRWILWLESNTLSPELRNEFPKAPAQRWQICQLNELHSKPESPRV